MGKKELKLPIRGTVYLEGKLGDFADDVLMNGGVGIKYKGKVITTRKEFEEVPYNKFFDLVYTEGYEPTVIGTFRLKNDDPSLQFQLLQPPLGKPPVEKPKKEKKRRKK